MLTPKEVFGHYKIKSATGLARTDKFFPAVDIQLNCQRIGACPTEDFVQHFEKSNYFISKANLISSPAYPNNFPNFSEDQIDGASTVKDDLG